MNRSYKSCFYGVIASAVEVHRQAGEVRGILLSPSISEFYPLQNITAILVCQIG